MREAGKESEKQYFDWAFGLQARKPVSKFYSVVRSSREYYENFLLSHSRKKKVLEYGCGTGSYAFFLAKQGAEVTGIDISPVAIDKAKARIQEERAGDIRFLVMDGETMQFEDCSFDLVCGTGILHHLRLGEALKELARVLKPEGKAIFIEPMAHNPAINVFRRLTPRFRSTGEHALRAKDLEFMKEFFHQANYDFFHFFSLLAVPFRNSRGFSSLLRRLDAFDRKLFQSVPFLRLLAWQVVIILEKPKKKHFA